VSAASLDAAPPAAAPPQSPSVTAQAKAKLKEDRHADAKKLLQDFLSRQPNAAEAPECAFLLAQAQGGQDSDALNIYSTLVRRYPQSDWAAQALEAQAVLQLKRRNPRAAQELRAELLARYPQSETTAKVWLGLADTHFEQEQYDKAAALYQKMEKQLSPAALQRLKTARVLSAGDDDPAKILPIAAKALNENDRTLAKTLYEQLAKSPKVSKDLPEIQTKLAWCLYLDGEEKNYRRAEQLWRGVIHSTPPSDQWHAEAYWHMVQLASGPDSDWKEAVSICDSIIKEQPLGSFPHEQAMFAKAWLLTVQDQGKAAVDAFSALAAAYPDKMLEPPVIQHRERALASAQKGDAAR